MNTLVSLPFITMIPIDCNFFPYICLFAFLNMQVLSGCIETDIKKVIDNQQKSHKICYQQFLLYKQCIKYDSWQKLDTCKHNSCLCSLFKILQNLTCLQLSAITSRIITTTATESFTRWFHVNNVFVMFSKTATYQHSFGPDISKTGTTYQVTLKKLPPLNTPLSSSFTCAQV